MADLKQISDEIAKAIFDRIEQDRTLILSNVADVIHKELAVRMPYRKEPDPEKAEKARQSWDEFKKFVHEWKPKPMRELREFRPRLTDYPRWVSWDLADDFPTEARNSDDLREDGNG